MFKHPVFYRERYFNTWKEKNNTFDKIFLLFLYVLLRSFKQELVK